MKYTTLFFLPTLQEEKKSSTQTELLTREQMMMCESVGVCRERERDFMKGDVRSHCAMVL